jgi:hypothetical protein
MPYEQSDPPQRDDPFRHACDRAGLGGAILFAIGHTNAARFRFDPDRTAWLPQSRERERPDEPGVTAGSSQVAGCRASAQAPKNDQMPTYAATWRLQHQAVAEPDADERFVAKQAYRALSCERILWG